MASDYTPLICEYNGTLEVDASRKYKYVGGKTKMMRVPKSCTLDSLKNKVYRATGIDKNEYEINILFMCPKTNQDYTHVQVEDDDDVAQILGMHPDLPSIHILVIKVEIQRNQEDRAGDAGGSVGGNFTRMLNEDSSGDVVPSTFPVSHQLGQHFPDDTYAGHPANPFTVYPANPYVGFPAEPDAAYPSHAGPSNPTPTSHGDADYYGTYDPYKSYGPSSNYNFDNTPLETWEHLKRFKPEDMQVQMDGKNCIVTGANSGIGYATAEGLASRGATVYMVCRSKERGEAALAKMQSTTSNPNIHLEICDLSSISEVKAFASKFSSEQKPIHVLINNAGILEHNRVTTSEGLELNFAVNVAATYTLTELMIPLLEKTAPDARVITVSSGGMYTSPLTKDLQFSESKFDGMLQYARNKRVQVALTEKWAETYGNRGIGFYSMHPGWAETPGVARSLPGFSQRLSGKLRTSEEGADTVIWLALQPKEKLVPGAFYFDRAEAPKHLPFAGTAGSHCLIGDVIDSLRGLCGLSS